MPRIRSFKPDIRSHRKMGPTSDRAFMLFFSLVTQADDEGRGVWDAAQFRAILWAYHPAVTVKDVEKAMAELLALRGPVVVYQDGNRQVYSLPSWPDHQRISHPIQSKFPPPPECQGNLLEDSGTSQNVLQGWEGKGRDRKGKDAGMAGFGDFWAAYPRKVAKGDAERAWAKLAPAADLRARILTAVETQRGCEAWAKDGGAFIPYPATWLNARRWEDEVGVSGVDLMKPSKGIRA